MTWDVSGWDWLWIAGHAHGWSLVLARVLGLCLTAPVLSAPGLEVRFRFGLSILLTILIAPVVGLVSAGSLGWIGLAGAGVAEILTGMMLGWAAGMIVAGAQLAGDLVAAQSGLSASTFFDPDTGEELTALGRLYGWVALVVFLSLDGPLVLVRALVQSYRAIPAGGLFSSPGSIDQVFSVLVGVLDLALRAAAPTAIALILAGVVMGWISRAAPSFPLLALTLPVRAMLGIVLVLLSLAALGVTLGSAWQSIGLSF
jgi:flagellar biosynthetic protein FliR